MVEDKVVGTKTEEESTIEADFRMRYQVCIEDIKYLKSRQWIVTYYLLLLYGAFIYLEMAGKEKIGDLLDLILAFLTVVVFIFGLYYQIDFHRQILIYRRCRTEIRSYLSPKFRLYEDKEEREGYSEWSNGVEYTLPLIGLLFVEAVITFLIIGDNYNGGYDIDLLWFNIVLGLQICLVIWLLRKDCMIHGTKQHKA